MRENCGGDVGDDVGGGDDCGDDDGGGDGGGGGGNGECALITTQSRRGLVTPESSSGRTFWMGQEKNILYSNHRKCT